jgi:cytidine deaminase
MSAGDDPRTEPGAAWERLMEELLPAAQALAVAPISGFAVGAVVRSASGTLYLGANLEFPGLALATSVHAEQAAIANAWAGGETEAVALAVTAAPCGHCRQFLNELAAGGRLLVFVRGEPATTLAALLPLAFGPADLGVSDRLMQPVSHGLVAAVRGEATDQLAAAALAAADSSYAPYGKTYAGVALELADGSIHAGRYAENAAFNPSLPPLQAALAALAMRSIPTAQVRRAALAETAGPVSQRAATESLLAGVAPGVALTYIRAAAGA